MLCSFCKEKLSNSLHIPEYSYCSSCKVFLRSNGDQQSFMVNEKLEDNTKIDQLTRKLARIVQKHKPPMFGGLVDFGCGGGKFLLGAYPNFKEVAGVEITPASILAAQAHGLTILNEIPRTGFQTLTFWHSLEHLPYQTLRQVFKDIENSEVIQILVSVPNAEAMTLKFFGVYDAYYDPENHIHIFSSSKIKDLFLEIGFKETANIRILEYSIFGAIQSSVNFITRTKNQIYLYLKRGSGVKEISFVKHIVFFPVYLSISLLLILISICNHRLDSVVSKSYTRIDNDM
jgi:hypothetical protein